MAVTSYGKETLPDGRIVTVAHHDNGLIERFDANNVSLGYEYAGATPLADLSTIPSGQAVVVDSNGYPVKDMRGQFLSAPVPQGVQTTQYQAPGHKAYDGGMVPSYAPQSAPVGQAPSYGGGLPNGGQSHDYSSGGWTNYGSRAGGGGANPYTASAYSPGYGNTPRYADGSVHPSLGGVPRTPGGTYRGPNGGVGGTGQQQVFVPGGAAAGPYDTSAASNAYKGAQFGDSGGGGGGSRSPLYSAIKAKGDAMAAKVRGMGTGGTSGSSYSTGGNAAYAKQQHAYNKEARQQQRAYDDGSYLYDSYKMRGFSKKMDPQQAEALMFRPSMLLPKVAKGLPSTSPQYSVLADLPAAQLSMMRYGAHGKAREGPSQFTNNLAKFYEKAAGSGDLPSYDQLTRNLATAKNKSPLGQMFAKQPLGYGADNYESMVTSIFGSTGLDPLVAAARTQTTQGLIDQYGSRNLNKQSKKAQPINRWIAKRSDFL